MNSILDNVASSLYNGQLPDEWRKYAPATCKTLGAWMQHFEKRNEQYHSWVSSLINYIVSNVGSFLKVNQKLLTIF